MDQEFQFFSDEAELTFPDAEGMENEDERVLKVRLDKWLWAARFFKTRALARRAVEEGKIYYNGERSRPSREIELGAILQILGRFEKTVIVKGLSTRRRSTEEALQLFEETADSKLRREQAMEWQQPQPSFQYSNRPSHISHQSHVSHQSHDYPPYPSPRRAPVNHHAQQQQDHYSQQSTPPYPSPYAQSRERRPVRFLRRTFNRNTPAQDSQPSYNQAPIKDQAAMEFESED